MLIMASYIQGMRGNLWCLITVFLCCNGQADLWKSRAEIGLCEKTPGFEPSGEYLASAGDKIMAYVNWNITQSGSVQMCLMRFSTCNSCRLRVSPVSRFQFNFCTLSADYSRYNGWCFPGCTYLHLYDKDYSSKNGKSKSYGNDSWSEDFVTESSTLYVVACSNKTIDSTVVMKINISSETKTTIHHAESKDVGGAFIMTSPFFPSDYMLNSEIYTYIFRCAAQDQFVTVSFDDWQLAPTSSITFDNANIVGPIKGSDDRPWVISNSSELVMTFDTGISALGDHMGFQATYTFQKEKDRVTMPSIVTNCGNSWITQSESGIISFPPTNSGRDFYDCIWVIKKDSSYDGVLVRVINYSLSVTSGTYYAYQPNLLQIRRGLTSTSQIMETAKPATGPADQQSFSTFISTDGFYVRLKGRYSYRDFVLAYASYNTDNCKGLFRCGIGICIPYALRCDGVDHCGDFSDEAYLLCGPSTSGGSSGGASYPSSLSVGIIIPLVVSIFLIIVICLLIVFIRRCRKLSYEAHRARQFGQHVNTISGAISSRQRRNRRRGNGSGVTFEPPPPYEEVLNTTPIGYLNMAFHEAHSSPLTGLLQPPTYEEAMTPPASGAPGGSHDLSSDSSSPDTGVHSQSFFSTSSSSDDTQPGGEQDGEGQHRLCRSSSAASADTSSDDMDHDDGWQSSRPTTGRGVETRPEVGSDQPNSRQSIAKPVHENVCTTVAQPANSHRNKRQINNKHRKNNSQQENEDGVVHIMSSVASLRMTSGDSVDGMGVVESGQVRRPNQPPVSEDSASALFCHVESSPVVCAPPVVQSSAPRMPQTQNPATQSGTDAELPTSRQREYSPQKRYARNPNVPDSRQVEQPARSGHDAGKRRHMGKSGQMPYSLLSRSMVDISGQNESATAKPLTSTKMLSKSVDNVLFASLASQFSPRGNGSNGSNGLSRASSSQGLWQDSASPQAEGDAVSGQRPSGSNPDKKDRAKPTPRPRKSIMKKASSGHASPPDERPERDEPQQQQQQLVEAASPSPHNSGRNEQNQRPVSSSEGRNIPNNRNHRPMQNTSKDSLDSRYPGVSPAQNSYNSGRHEGGRGEPGATRSAGHLLGQSARKPGDQIVNSHGQERSGRTVQPSAPPYKEEHDGRQPRVATSSSEMAQTSGGRSVGPRNRPAQMGVPGSERQPGQGHKGHAQPDFPRNGDLSSRQNAPQQPRDARAGGELDYRNDRPLRPDGSGAWPKAPQQPGTHSGKRESHPPRDASHPPRDASHLPRDAPDGGHRQGGDGRARQDRRGDPKSERPYHPRLSPGEKMPPPYSPRDSAPAGEFDARSNWHALPPAYSQPSNRNPAREVRHAVDNSAYGHPSSRPSRSTDSHPLPANLNRDRQDISETKDRHSNRGMTRENSAGSRMGYSDAGSRSGAASYRTEQDTSVSLEDGNPGDMFV